MTLPGSSWSSVPVRMARAVGRLPFFASLRVRLLLLVALALIPAAVLIVYNALEQRHLGIKAAHDDAARMVRFLSKVQDEMIVGARQLLSALAQMRNVHSNNTAVCQSLFANLRLQHPVYVDIGGIAADGTVFASAVPLAEPLNLADRKYFQMATNTRSFVVGEYQLSRDSRKTTVNLAYPAIDDHGNIKAVVYASLDLGWLYRVMGDSALPPGTSMTVLDRNLVTLARFPDDRFVGGQIRLPSTRVGATPPSGRAPDGMRISQSRDGTWRLYASTSLGRVEPQPLVINVGIPLAAAYGPANHQLVRNLGFLGIAALLAFTAAWFAGDLFVLRPVRLLVSATRQLAQGDLAVRTGETSGTGELYELARSFDDMASSLQERGHERDRAEANLRKLNEQLEQRVADRSAALQRSNEELEQFAYVISHDLQEPLRMVSQYLLLLERRHGAEFDEDARNLIASAGNGAERMQALIRGLLEYSRTGTRPKIFAPTETEQPLQDALTNLTLLIHETGTKIVHDPLPRVQGDIVQLTQLFQNLIGNAIKFRSNVPPVIQISAQREEFEVPPSGSPAFWRFAVRDNGLGIPQKDLPRVFVVFQHFHNGNDAQGMGIGLAVCKKIVQRHGGKIWVESRENEGSTFYFTLPAVTTKSTLTTVPSIATAGHVEAALARS